MKHRVIRQATAIRLENADGDGPATVASGTNPPREARAVSETIVSRFVTCFDAIAIFVAGAAAMHWDPSTADWRL